MNAHDSFWHHAYNNYLPATVVISADGSPGIATTGYRYAEPQVAELVLNPDPLKRARAAIYALQELDKTLTNDPEFSNVNVARD